MSERMDAELADLAYDEAEGAADFFDESEDYDGAEMYDEFASDAGDDFDLGDEEEFEEEEFEAFADESDEFDEGEEEFDEFDAYDEEADELEEAMAMALGAEDADEFFKRAFGFLKRAAKGAVNVARKAAPVIGKIARTAAPIARGLPIPWVQAAVPALNLLSKLRMEGASPEEALDAFAELAAYDESVLPIVAGLAARAAAGPKIARAPLVVRRRMVRNMTKAARTLVQKRGPAAVRAVPKVVKSVKRAAVVRRTPVAARPQIAQKTVRKVAVKPTLVKRLARPTPAAVARVRTVIHRRTVAPLGRIAPVGGRRTFVMRGPVRVSITSA